MSRRSLKWRVISYQIGVYTIPGGFAWRHEKLSGFFFFQAPKTTDPVVQWSVQWPNDITILNRAGVQWLSQVTPDGGYTSAPKWPRNQTWPP